MRLPAPLLRSPSAARPSDQLRGERTGKEPVTMDLRRILAATDHTQLSPTATAADIARLCAEAARDRTASVCVAPARVREAKKELERLGVLLPVCTVIGFPNGYSSTEVKACEAAAAIEDGADELDMVVNLGDVKDGRFDRVLSEINRVKGVCNGRILKVIIETCCLTDEEKVRLCGVVSFSGADFLKTSTGFGSAGATREDVLLLKAHLKKGTRLKAAGGINTLETAWELLTLGADRLGSSRLVKLAEACEAETERADG